MAVTLTGWRTKTDIQDFAPQMKAITELHMLRNLEKKAHSSRNVPLSLCVIRFHAVPNQCFILNLGLESLHVRMPKHVENGQAVAEFLESHPKVAYVNYPGLPSNKYYDRAKKYLPNGGCGVVSFGLKGGREAASTFMQNLKLGAIETHVADARTCCLNPATSTHRQMTDEQLIEAGVPAELIRISLGLEDKEDLIADISNALDAIK